MNTMTEMTAGAFRAAHESWVADGAGTRFGIGSGMTVNDALAYAGKQRLTTAARDAVDTTPGSPTWRPPA